MNSPINYIKELRRIDAELGALGFRGRYPLRDLELLYVVEEIAATNWQNDRDRDELDDTVDETMVRLFEAGLRLPEREDWRYDEEYAEELLRELEEEGR